jgi:hypothetical protein
MDSVSDLIMTGNLNGDVAIGDRRVRKFGRILLCIIHLGGLCGGVDLAIGPPFSPSGFWDTDTRMHSTQVNLMGPMLSILLKQPERPGDRGQVLRIVCTAARSCYGTVATSSTSISNRGSKKSATKSVVA